MVRTINTKALTVLAMTTICFGGLINLQSASGLPNHPRITGVTVMMSPSFARSIPFREVWRASAVVHTYGTFNKVAVVLPQSIRGERLSLAGRTLHLHYQGQGTWSVSRSYSFITNGFVGPPSWVTGQLATVKALWGKKSISEHHKIKV